MDDEEREDMTKASHPKRFEGMKSNVATQTSLTEMVFLGNLHRKHLKKNMCLPPNMRHCSYGHGYQL
jgi:hypothetical protein